MAIALQTLFLAKMTGNATISYNANSIYYFNILIIDAWASVLVLEAGFASFDMKRVIVI
jgi:hypothetical protein